jgi:hypothetical protein
MSELNNLNVETKDDVLLSIINRAWQGEFGGGFQGFESAERAMESLPAYVLRSCLILKWLGLVERDDNHAFGYKPTRHLMPLFSRNLKHPIPVEIDRDYAHPEETDCLYCIYEAAVPCKVRGLKSTTTWRKRCSTCWD